MGSYFDQKSTLWIDSWWKLDVSKYYEIFNLKNANDFRQPHSDFVSGGDRTTFYVNSLKVLIGNICGLSGSKVIALNCKPLLVRLPGYHLCFDMLVYQIGMKTWINDFIFESRIWFFNSRWFVLIGGVSRNEFNWL